MYILLETTVSEQLAYLLMPADAFDPTALIAS